MSVVVEVEDLSMAYRVYEKPSDALKERLFGGKRHDLFWALRDLSFRIHERQRVGIIGPNGAGKSTLLQIITGILRPTTGRVRVNGKISALLSLTPTWNIDENGVENIRFNLLLQGCAPRRIPALTEEIVEFTELGPFIYQPVRTYSSGMSSRLAFAIATAISPEVLVIDEVLGAGDAYFAGKAYRRMKEFCDRGKALLFVSHSTDAVQRMCDTVIWLQNGAVREIGSAESVLKQYEMDYRRREDEVTRSAHKSRSETRSKESRSSEIDGQGVARFRIVPEDNAILADTHYIRLIRIELAEQIPFEIDLEGAILNDGAAPGNLDVLASEWGRIHDRRGAISRMLLRNSGRNQGGQFTVKLNASDHRGSLPVRVTIQSSSLQGREPLIIQMMSQISGEWQDLRKIRTADLGDDWREVAFEGEATIVKSEQVEAIRQIVEERAKPDVDLVEAFVLVDDERTLMVRERQPFSIGVRIFARRQVAVADAGIKLTRSDGTYVFWQSSGLDGENLRDLLGERTVLFHFDENVFGAGEYLLSAYVANGWDLEMNYPYSEVLVREVFTSKFTVMRERAELDMGVVNVRARIEPA
jgi:lipopolysaccharide transport system ATP-binding protein